MDKKSILFLVLAIVVLVSIIGVITVMMTYNKMMGLLQECHSQWAKVETVYQERLDLIPNIVATVSSETKTEVTLLTNLANARANYINAKDSDGKILAAQQVNGFIAKVLLLHENYPNLKFSKGYAELRTVLEGQENRIRVERNRYNDAVKNYNIAIKSYPDKFLADMFGFKEKIYFQAEEGAEKVPKVGNETQLP